MDLSKLKIPKILSNQLLEMAANASDENLLKMLKILGKFASIKWYHNGFAALEQMVKDQHSGIAATRRMFKNAGPAARSALINNMILGSLLLGYHKRLAFYNQQGIAPLGTLMISPTLKCNLRCYGCYSGAHENKNELTHDEVDKILSEASDAGTNFVILLGGEPFIVPWLVDLIEKHSSMAFLVFTNATLIDDAKVDRLAAVGNAAIAISVDGFEDETDRRRGPGAFKTATTLMQKLNQAGVLVGFSAMLSSRNFDTIYSDPFLDAMIENGAGFGWVPITLPQGRACVESELLLSEDQKKEVYQKVKDARARKPILLMDFLNDARMTEGCSAGRIIAHINANGDVEPCVLMPFSKDNIREKPLAEILDSDFFCGLRDINTRYRKEAPTCMWVHRPREVLEVINTCGVKATSEGVLERLNELAEKQ